MWPGFSCSSKDCALTEQKVEKKRFLQELGFEPARFIEEEEEEEEEEEQQQQQQQHQQQQQ